MHMHMCVVRCEEVCVCVCVSCIKRQRGVSVYSFQ